jgi:DNA replicative helicase MCM subunit Mcm2 (Cdc46/Mcm family)
VSFRADIREHKKQTGSSPIPITVRQLEAIIRISEALARMELSAVATADHVKEAIRLFQVSTFQAATSSFGERIGTPEFDKAVRRAEKYIDARVPIGATVRVANMIRDAVGELECLSAPACPHRPSRRGLCADAASVACACAVCAAIGHDEQAVLKAIAVQTQRNKYQSKRQGKDLVRILP